MYLAGVGIPQDYVQAYMWLNLSAARGIKRAAEERGKRRHSRSILRRAMLGRSFLFAPLLTEGAGSAGGKLPTGALQTRTDLGAPGYGGPCPPAGDHPHRYLFTVFVVKADKLDVKVDTSAAVVGFNLHSNRLAEAKIMGLFKR
jgi:hypothetical protein